MSLLEIWLLAVALAMDCLTVSIVSGVIWSQGDRHPCDVEDITSCLSPCNAGDYLRMALLFGLFQALMPLIGWAGTNHFSNYLEAVDHWIAFGLLAFIGGRMIKESFEEEAEQHFDPCRLRTQLVLAVATSIDALAVGISFACMGYDRLSQLTVPLLIIGLVSFLFSVVGSYVGMRFGRNNITRRLRPELLGGMILIGIGVRILVTHLFS